MPNLTNDLEAASGTRLSRAVRPSISRRHPSRPSPALCASTDALIVTQQACPLEHSRAVLRALSWHRAAEACLHSVRRPAIDTTFFSSPHSSDRTSPPHTATRNNPDVCDRHSIANRRLIERLSIASDVCDRRQARDELRGISISSGLANVRSFALIRVQTGNTASDSAAARAAENLPITPLGFVRSPLLGFARLAGTRGSRNSCLLSGAAGASKLQLS